MPDGVFAEDDAGVLTFHRLDPPDDDDVERLLLRIARRIDALVAVHEPADIDEDHAAVAVAVDLPLSTGPGGLVAPSRPRCAFVDGYSLHADLDVHRDERKMLERLLRYGLRPPFAQRRLSLTADGKVRLKLRKPTPSGQAALVLDPLDFLRRLVATIPPPRMNLTRFHGVFAPNAKAHSAVRALVPSSPADPAPANDDAGHACPATDPQVNAAEPAVPPRYRRPWHELLRRAFDIELVCGDCGAKMHQIAHIEDPDTIATILGHLGLPTTVPPIAPARAPPQLDLALADEPLVDDLPAFDDLP